ncbi:ectoine hydroxylase, partial [bacterium]|nr:ectoine hydroxylase [bacterium]
MTTEELASYESDGFLLLEEALDDREVRSLDDELEAVAAAMGSRDERVIREPGSDTVRSVFQIHELSGRVAELASDPRLLGRVRQILGSEAYIHQSRVNFKPGLRGKEFYWHSDFETWHVEDGMPRPRAVSASIILTPNNEFNGPLMLVPGSHKVYVRCVGETPEDNYMSSLKKQEIGTPSADALTAMVRDGGIVAPKGEAGSVIFFDCNTMHGSAGNISPFPRNNVFFVYNSLENALTEPFGADKPRPDFLGDRDAPPVGRL